MRARSLIFILAVVAVAAPVRAATVEVVVRASDGAPLRDAVVSIAVPGQRASAFPWPMRVTQRDIAFDPFVLVVPRGATVSFPNKDKVRHQVYSFSRAKKFELKLYGRDETRTVTFDVPGTVALGCNIHDRMTAFVRVVDTPFAAKTDAAGRVSIAGVPPGAAVITVWHPRALARGGEFSSPATIAAGGTAKTVTLRTAT